MSVIVDVSNVIRLYNLPAHISLVIQTELSFENPKYITAARVGRSTRGIPKRIKSYKLHKNYLTVQRGYLDRLFQLLADHNIDPEVHWNTTIFEPTRLDNSIQLRSYQQTWFQDLSEFHQGVGVAPPGAGKTILALQLYASLGQPCLWLTHTNRLAKQVAEAVRNLFGVEPGFIGAGKESFGHFTVGLIPTLVRRDLSEIKDKFGLVILDEAHHAPSTTFTDVLSQFSAHFRYGVTATPYRDDGLEPLMFDVLGPQRSFIDRATLRDLGYLMTPTVYKIPTNFQYDWLPGTSFKQLEKDLSENEERNRQICTDILVESTADERNVCIVLVSRIPHMEVFHEMLDPLLPGVGYVHSKMSAKKADEALNNFEAGNYKVLIATYKMLAEGFDYPPSNRLFLTAPYKGRTLVEQATGRVERVAEGKTDAVVYDYADVNVGVLENQARIRQEIFEENNNPVIENDTWQHVLA